MNITEKLLLIASLYLITIGLYLLFTVKKKVIIKKLRKKK